jgi:putative spermidine/putrescine transport system permease protein
MRAGPVIRMATVVGVVYLTVPTLLVIVSSFDGGRQIVFPPNDPSFDAYGDLFRDGDFGRALLNSLYLATVATLIDIVVAVPAALAFYRHRVRATTGFVTFMSLGLMTPIIVSAIAFLIVFTEFGVLEHLTSVAVGIAVVLLPLMLWAVGTSVADLDPELEQAADSLGAEEIQQLLFVTLPQLAPGILTGALLTWMLALTDFVVSVVLTNENNITLPVLVYSGLRVAVSPSLAAAAAVFIAIASVVVFVVLRMGRIEQFLYRR